MKNIKESERGAIFKTVMAFYDGKKELFSEGIVRGIIAQEKKGLAGFGYDSIFYVVEEKKTFSEMSIDDKNKISHRGLAIKNFKLTLNSYLKEIQNKKESA